MAAARTVLYLLAGVLLIGYLAGAPDAIALPDEASLLLSLAVFGGGFWKFNRWLRRRDEDGYTDASWDTSHSHPGMRYLFRDSDGRRQRR